MDDLAAVPAVRKVDYSGEFFAGRQGRSCDETCREKGKRCDMKGIKFANSCDVIKEHFPCKMCWKSQGSDQVRRNHSRHHEPARPCSQAPGSLVAPLSAAVLRVHAVGAGGEAPRRLHDRRPRVTQPMRWEVLDDLPALPLHLKAARKLLGSRGRTPSLAGLNLLEPDAIKPGWWRMGKSRARNARLAWPQRNVQQDDFCSKE